ncbi:MAG: AAA family ATPase, partial [Candidatus Poribacteria bacterium]|nr:AAA family ATPase [Candidatus Poribacteria bacterium]
MKICKLKLKSLNSFRGEVEIDFEKSPLDDASLVAITGPTGSGKTTLLDAICVALYGKTPRLSGTTNQHPRHLISHGETEGFAEVYFEANSTRYHATWSIKRKGSPKGQLFDDSDELITTKVAQKVESILGLDFDAFRRSVMLAQGEFAAFLKATDEKRRTILEATAGISIYDVLKQALNNKVNAVEAANAEVSDKLNKIPEASREQLTDAEAEFDRLQTEADTLAVRSQQIQKEKDRETKRTEDFEKLQSSEERQDELLNQQPMIDALQIEQGNANRAERLRTEKQEFDSAKSELEKATAMLSSAETEKVEAEEQVETDQTVYDQKAAAYSEASAERDRKTQVYAAAKSDVERASERFAEADKRMPELTDVSDRIDTLENQLADKQTKHTQLQKQIKDAQRFLDENSLPSNPRDCLKRANRFLSELVLQEKQLETASATKTQHEKKVSLLKRDIKELSKTREKHLSDKSDAEATLTDVSIDLNMLEEVGSREEWNERKKNALEAQPIAQEYETVNDDLVDSEDDMGELNEAKAGLDAEFGQIESELTSQTDVCQRTVETVQYCEEARESAMFASPINQLRQRLRPGKS